ncbi:cupin domain-containing protein [Maribacter confluentis]|uniref:Cupin domain-containing protein n=1 Tax=Maribacter confluentis TaxID=1656093 RepID=A0ABT8RJ70_9FLAO|nr:cupin domain-containing protein [Maribacter confluentis]MDO1511121.1 cupin domain-containing protein [Maribacter confluentis]
MKSKTLYRTLLILVLFIGCNESTEIHKDATLFSKGEIITNENFTGTTWLNMMATPDSLNTMYAGLVTFEAGARTNWHSHPAGQVLIATKGKGYYQEEGKAKQIMLLGETIKCLPNIKHWHGASQNSEFAHIAISDREKGPAK